MGRKRMTFKQKGGRRFGGPESKMKDGAQKMGGITTR